MNTTEAAEILDTPATSQSTQTTGQGASTEANPKASNGNDKISSKLDLLIRREQQAFVRESAAKQKEADLESKLKRIEEFESVKTNPKKALELLGLNYDELTKSILADGEIPAEVQLKKIEEKFDSFRSAQEEATKKQEEEKLNQAKAQEQQAISGFKTEINTYLKDNATRYEFIAFEESQELVFDVIDEQYNRTMDPQTGIGKVMSIAEAADKVEEHLEKKYKKAKELNKTKTLWSAVPSRIQPPKPETRATQPQHRTLTNQLSASQTKPRTRPITDEERVQKAIAYAKGLRP